MRDPFAHGCRGCMVAGIIAVLFDLLIVGSLPAKSDEGHSAAVTAADSKSDTAIDSQKDLQEIFDLAARTSRRVVLPAGTFRHSRALLVQGIQVSGAGASTIIEGTTRDDASIVVTGKDSKLSHLKLVFRATRRSQSDTSALVLVQNAKDFTVENLVLDGSDSVGIFVSGSTHGVVSGNEIHNTLADSIHITRGASDILVRDNATYFSGDDGISVVSYEKDDRAVKHISILRNSVLDNKYARGISVVGGEDIDVADNRVRCTAGYAGIYVASESSYRTYGTEFVTIKRNAVQRCGSAKVGHGGITIFSDYKGNNHVSVENNDVSASPAVGILVLGGPNVDVTLKDNIVAESHDSEIVLYRQDHPLAVFGNTREDGAPASPRLIATESSILRGRP